ncbi:hypothetical protein CDAR_229321 [Caerostris darwini]|uniref:Reverse transcriptase domain-containing protein n=1 Tax=Caerostris darwini TaxID=1538125 RepID=A0AAV4PZI2_9ARAC|nr:hypothetical protein CDAR_229321 [Caerostris darwini]
MLSTRLNYVLETYDFLEEEQTDFRKGMPNSNYILKLVYGKKTDFNSKKSTLAVFVVFQGAYDTICRKRLLNKLKKDGVKDKLLNWIKRFLAQRLVRIRWNNI